MTKVYIHKTNRKVKKSNFILDLRQPKNWGVYNIDMMFTEKELDKMFNKVSLIQKVGGWLHGHSKTKRGKGKVR